MAMKREFKRVQRCRGSKKGQSVEAYEELDFCTDLKSLEEIAFLNKVIHWTVKGTDKCYRVNNAFASETLRCSQEFFKKIKKRLLNHGYIEEELVPGYPSEFKATKKTMVLVGLDKSPLPY